MHQAYFSSPSPIIDQKTKMLTTQRPANTERNCTYTPTSFSPRGSRPEFPTKLYALLELSDIIPEFMQAISWMPHGRAFSIHDEGIFMEEVAPIFFNQTKIRSFKRQLHLWQFRRISRGHDDDVWYHDNFLRGVPESLELMSRTKVKGNVFDKYGLVSIPNFHELPSLPARSTKSPAVLKVMEESISKLQTSSFAQSVLTMLHSTDHHFISSRSEQLPKLDDWSRDASLKVSSQSSASTESRCASSKGCRQSDEASGSVTWEKITRVNVPSQAFKSRVKSNILQGNFSSLWFSPIKPDNDEDFEPLPFRVEDDSHVCEDLANFIHGVIQNIEN